MGKFPLVNFGSIVGGKNPKKQSIYTDRSYVSQVLRSASNQSTNQRRKNGHAMPSLPTITIPFADDGEPREVSGKAKAKRR
jgi:hypothetical protein